MFIWEVFQYIRVIDIVAFAIFVAIIIWLKKKFGVG
jgi:hypothetical protein